LGEGQLTWEDLEEYTLAPRVIEIRNQNGGNLTVVPPEFLQDEVRSLSASERRDLNRALLEEISNPSWFNSEYREAFSGRS
jgi:hypothetical protein